MAEDIPEILVTETLDTRSLRNDPMIIMEHYTRLSEGDIIEIADLNGRPLYFVTLINEETRATEEELRLCNDILVLAELNGEKFISVMRTGYSIILITPEGTDNIFLRPVPKPAADKMEASRKSVKSTLEAGAKQPVASELPDEMENAYSKDELSGPEVLTMVNEGGVIILMQGTHIYASVQAFDPEIDNRLAGNPLANYGSEAFWRLLEEKGRMIVYQGKNKLFTITLLREGQEILESSGHGAEEPTHDSREADEKDFWSTVDLAVVNEKIEGGEVVKIMNNDGRIIATIRPFSYPQDDGISTSRFTCLKEGGFWKAKKGAVLLVSNSGRSSKPKKFATVVFNS